MIVIIRPLIRLLMQRAHSYFFTWFYYRLRESVIYHFLNKDSRYEWPITNPLIATRNYYNFHTYNAGGPAWFYCRLVAPVIYHFLNKDTYFNEDD